MSSKTINLFSGWLKQQGREREPIGRVIDITGRVRREAPTQPPPSLMSVELDERADQLEAHIAQTQLTVSGLRRTAARLRGSK
jgi:hypothetical protein